MISHLQRKSLKVFHPLLRRLAKNYLSKPRYYTYEDIKIRVMPGVFHPGLFFSTKVLLEFISKRNLSEKSILELGAGSGIISIFCAKRGGIVTASDINHVALQELTNNAKKNSASIHIQESDLFDQLNIEDYDLIIINPPYYPKNPGTVEDHAWFCGEGFEYFKKLYGQLEAFNSLNTEVIMILSEDCKVGRIQSIAKDHKLSMDMIYQKKISGEKNYIYRIINDEIN